jgi:hypothetical protein
MAVAPFGAGSRFDGTIGIGGEIKPWKLTQAIGTGANVIFERNPYYWKVDTKGQQMPYIDKLQFQVVENPEMVAMKAIGVAGRCTGPRRRVSRRMGGLGG